ncbi:GGDEF domain-containing protein [Wukongibacter baidiensis]|uniref:GGDEF domain-containing protein n=1 Tax=Wukongibacter baidiensis TaxID=1723361 RepID=UPI003D7FEE14
MRVRKILIACLLFLILFWSLSYLPRPTGYVLDKNWSLTIDNKTIEIELPYYQFPKKSGLAEFKTSFNKPEGDTLVIPKISCYAFKVYINDFLISQAGDFDSPTANIWNYAQVISIDDKILKEKNDLRIETYLLDDVGMHIPPFIDLKKNVIGRISVFNFINNDIHLIMLGISISIAFIMITISIFNKEHRIMYLCLGLSTILVSLYSFDCLYRLYSGDINTFLFIRKILFSSCYGSGIFLIWGIEKYTNRTLKLRRLIFLSVVLAIILVMTSEDFITLRSRINILNVITVISPIYTIVLFFKHKMAPFIFPMSFVTLTLIYTVLSVILKGNTPYMFPYGIIVYSVGLGFTIILEFTNIYNEKIKIYEKSVTDQLTGAYNRNILEDIHMNIDDTLILIDVDNLKYYNDTYGHSHGDALLSGVVTTIKNHIKENDFIIRLGGDEFLIVLKNTEEAVAKKIIASIRQEFKEKIQSKKVDISFGILRYQADFESSYSQVDKIMYKMKADKKYSKAEDNLPDFNL